MRVLSLHSGDLNDGAPAPAVEARAILPQIERSTATYMPRRQAWAMPRLGWVEWFVLFQFACQLALLIPGIGPLRILLRCAAFGVSVLYLFLAPETRDPRHPAIWGALSVIVILGLSLFHPWGNTIFACGAQFGLYVAILAPLFWTPRLSVDVKAFRRIAIFFWAFYTLSAGVGVLQVYFPGKFQAAVSQVIEAKGSGYVESLKITLSNGAQVFRPMGLTDQPGGAAMAGLYAVLFGLGLLLTEKSQVLRIVCGAGIAVGLFCLYLAQVRSVFVMTAICCVSFCSLLVVRGDIDKFVKTVGLLFLLILVSFGWAFSLGGDAVTKRLASFVDSRADDVYYANRGHFLDETINEWLPKFPFGAGLGRWGMMGQYFGDPAKPNSDTIWVEIQWTGWLLDGGVPLILAYVAALSLAFLFAWKVAKDRKAAHLGVWGSLIFAYNLAAVAMTFNYPLFIGQSGLEFWLLNACLFAAYQASKKPAEVAA